MEDIKTSGTVKNDTKAPKIGKVITKHVAKTVKPTDKLVKQKASMLSELKKGDSFKFGSYYQESSSNKTPIEWLVLKKSGSKVLLISQYGLDCKQYHHEEVNTNWENSDIRKWLNEDFLMSAFTEAEQKKIEVTNLVNENNAENSTFGENNTQDRVFLLSLAEAKSLFEDDDARKCEPTPYAVKKGAWQASMVIEYIGCCAWWLRSPGSLQGAAYIYAPGIVFDSGDFVTFDRNVVRPALWVNL